MKNIIAILLLGLVTFSFMGDAGLLSFPKKAKMEITDDMEGEKETKDKSEKEKYASFFTSFINNLYSEKITPCTPLVTRLFHVSYEVEFRPPRA